MSPARSRAFAPAHDTLRTTAAFLPRRRTTKALAVLAMAAACALHMPAVSARADEPSLPTLIQVLKDPSKSTSEKGDACCKLMDMGTGAKPAVPALIDLLGNSDQDLRDCAITTLQTIGPGASVALPALRKVAANDASPEIRSLAAATVRTISGKAPMACSAPADSGRASPLSAPAAAPRAAGKPDGEAGDAGGGPVAHDPAVMASVFPSLAHMAAPDWVKPGVTLTYYAASATIAGEGPIFHLDPQGPIEATDGSGRRFSAMPGGRDEGMAGQGYIEFTIVSVSPRAVAIAVDVYGVSGTEATPRLVTRTALVGVPGSAVDLWVSPTWLKHVKAGLGKNMRILRMPFKVGAIVRPAVAFTTPSSDMVFVYDAETGLLFYHVGSGEGEKGLTLRLDGQDVPNEPSHMLMLSCLVNKRNPSLPWTNKPLPDWASRVRALQYAGQVSVTIPGSPSLPLQVSASVQVAARANHGVRFHVSQAAAGVAGAPPAREEYDWMAGIDQLQAVWIPPTGIAGLHPGQTLDTDPVTGVVTTVSCDSTLSNGTAVVVISRTSQVQRLDYGYDRSTGMLVYVDQYDRTSAGDMRTTLYLRGSE